MKSSLGAIILNVAVIHGAGLVLLSQSQTMQAPHGTTAAPVVHLRLAKAEAAPVDTAPSGTRPSEAVLANEGQTSAPATEETAPPDSAQPQPQNSDAQASPRATDLQAPVEEYVPRPRLSLPPQAATRVIVPFPAQVDATGRFTAVLALFIDEDGIVRRVRVDDSTLPSSMQDAATQAFLQAHFLPGQVQGQVVKSLIHIEVVFDNTPLTPDATSYRTL